MADSDDQNRSGIYLDFNATTPLASEVIDSMSVAMVEFWGNPSSSHRHGRAAKRLLSCSRQQVAAMINASSEDIIFTSGGTEANNMIFNTFLGYFPLMITDESKDLGSETYLDRQRPHFIIDNIEHDSVTEVVKHYLATGIADVTIVPVNPATGMVEVKDVMSAILPTTCLVSVMLANNETGIIQPVAELCSRMKKLVRHPGETKKVFVHSDASQAIGKIHVDVQFLDVDYLTLTGHKFYGPRIGALYAKDPGVSTPLLPLMFGGGQERGLRSGTENTVMIAGFGKACELVSLNLPQYNNHMTEIRDYLEHKLQDRFGGEVTFNACYADSKRLPNTCSVSFRHPLAKGRNVLQNCRVLEASVGAACHSNSGASSVLLASGVRLEDAERSLRLSVGRETTHRDIDYVVEDLVSAINKLK